MKVIRNIQLKKRERSKFVVLSSKRKSRLKVVRVAYDKGVAPEDRPAPG